MITNDGKDVITRFNAQQLSTQADYIALGVSVTPETLSDKELGYEVIRLPIESVNPDLDNHRIVFKSVLPAGVMGKVYEVGLFQGEYVGTSRPFILTQNLQPWTNATEVTTNAKAGLQTVKVDFSTSGTTNAELLGLSEDLSNFSDLDRFSLSFEATTNLSSMRIRLGTDSSNYYEFLISSPATGYNIRNFTKSQATVTGTPTWSNIEYMAVRPSGTAGGSGSVYIDGMKFETDPLAAGTLLVARKVLGTVFTPDANIPSEIEYPLVVNAA